jgi:uncharacterized membrane protein YdjX (TVP38/TMEM64 family)
MVGDQRGDLDGPVTVSAAAARVSPRIRLALVGLIALTTLIVVRLSGIADSVSPESLRALMAGAGVFGILVFILVFTLGLLAQLPGLLFIAVAVLAYGRGPGILVALAGSIVAVSVTFLVVRRFGGRALTEMESPLLRRMLAQLDTRPLSSVIMLRIVFGVAPFLNYALALSSLGFREYLIGSVIGMTPPIALAALILDAAL